MSDSSARRAARPRRGAAGAPPRAERRGALLDVLGPPSTARIEEPWSSQGPRGQSVRGQAYRRLRRAIILCEITPGQSLSEQELASLLGVSRTPVREALQQLADDGLVVIRPQQGTEASRISPRRVREAQFVRELLERSALALSAQRRLVRRVELEDHLLTQDRAAEAHDFRTFFESDQLFHRGLAASSGFEGFGRIADSARAHLDRVRALSLPEPPTMQRMAAEHRGILEKLVGGDVAGADELLRAHLRSVLHVLPLISRRFPEYFVAEPDDQATVELVALEVVLHPQGAG